MSIFNVRMVIIVLATALSATAYAAPKQGGGHGGGASHSGGGPRAGSAQISHAVHGGGGARHVTSRATTSRSLARPSTSHSFARQGTRGNRTLSVHQTSNRSVGSGRLSSPRGNATRNTTSNATLKATARSNVVRNTLNSGSVGGTLRNTRALRNPATRASITASAATAGLNYRSGGGSGWWRHGTGGYGWVGPVFWPFAYYDVYGYAMWGYGYDSAFWGYGYGDIYAGVFAPYGYDDLAGYYPPQYASASPNDLRAARASGAPRGPIAPLAQMCGQDSHDIAGLPIDQIQQAIQPNSEQRAALDDLANASLKAAQDIKAACPTDIVLTAPDRLAAMQQRIEAMISAVATVQPALDKFYGLLSDEQKERMTALGNNQRQSQNTETTGSLAQTCGETQARVTEWPTAEIDRRVHPNATQRGSLDVLQNASAKAADMLKSSCAADNALTPPARLAAVGKQLNTMLEAVKTVHSALNDFYASLNDEQKAQFEAIGPTRTSQR